MRLEAVKGWVGRDMYGSQGHGAVLQVGNLNSELSLAPGPMLPSKAATNDVSLLHALVLVLFQIFSCELGMVAHGYDPRT